MATETATSTQTTTIDPTIQPSLKYGLDEAQRLYQAGGPKYYTGDTYVKTDPYTTSAISELAKRATAGSELTDKAQTELLGTIKGDYLGGNPFFQGAFQPAATSARQAFETALGDIGSKASLAGRYGSGAMNTQVQGAAGEFAKKLTDTAGKLAYENYAQERARQQQATGMAPAMAEADYTDIQKLLAAGQLNEGYAGKVLQADIEKYNFLQNLPQQQLNQYLNQVYGFPAGKTTTTETPYYTNPLATGLGTGLLGVNLLTSANKLTGGSLGNYITSGLNSFLYPGYTTSGLENTAGVNFLTGDNYG